MLEYDEALYNMPAILIRRILVQIFEKDIKSVIDKWHFINSTDSETWPNRVRSAL